MTVRVRTDSSFSFASAELVFEKRYSIGSGRRPYDVSPDGERFLMIKPGAPDETATTELILVQNWTEELQRLVPVDN